MLRTKGVGKEFEHGREGRAELRLALRLAGLHVRADSVVCVLQHHVQRLRAREQVAMHDVEKGVGLLMRIELLNDVHRGLHIRHRHHQRRLCAEQWWLAVRGEHEPRDWLAGCIEQARRGRLAEHRGGWQWVLLLLLLLLMLVWVLVLQQLLLLLLLWRRLWLWQWLRLWLWLLLLPLWMLLLLLMLLVGRLIQAEGVLRGWGPGSSGMAAQHGFASSLHATWYLVGDFAKRLAHCSSSGRR